MSTVARSTKAREYLEIGVTTRPRNDNRPTRKIYMDLESGIMVTDREKFEKWIILITTKPATLEEKVPVFDGRNTQLILAEQLRIKAKKNLRKKPPFKSDSHKSR